MAERIKLEKSVEKYKAAALQLQTKAAKKSESDSLPRSAFPQDGLKKFMSSLEPIVSPEGDPRLWGQMRKAKIDDDEPEFKNQGRLALLFCYFSPKSIIPLNHVSI